MTIHSQFPCHTGNYAKGRTGRIRYLVIHYVGAEGGAEANAKYFSSHPGLQASAHYFVGHSQEGAAVYASVAEKDTAWHVGAKRYAHPDCRNANSIGIELCCHRSPNGTWFFDPETVDQAAALARDIMDRHSISTDRVLRHYDVTSKVCPAPFVSDPAAWAAFLHRLL